MATSVELAPDYYLTNFRLLLAWVEERYGDLLLPEELRWLHHFAALSHPAACLLVRLLSRKGEWFRADRLHYPEIGQLPLAELAEAGLIRLATPRWSELGPLLTRPELLALAPSLPKGQRKEQWLARLADTPLPTLPFQTLKVEDKPLLGRFLLLFFGNREQDLTEFVLLDLGHYRYEPYPLSPADRLFDSRTRLEEWLSLDAWHDNWQQAREQGGPAVASAWLAQLPPSSDWPPLAARHERLRLALARDLERAGENAQALALYRTCQRSPSRERQVRLLLVAGELAEAERLLAEMEAAPHNEEERAVTRPLRDKLCRLRGDKVTRHRRPTHPTWSLALPSWPGRVEEATLAALHADGWQGFWCENALINGLFGLAFWDIIFSPQPGVFFNRYQRAPADMFSRRFGERRQALIDTRRQSLAAPAGWEALLDRYDEKVGTVNAWVEWERLPRVLLELALHHIPLAHRLAMLDRLCFDLRGNRSGQPDLALFREEAYCLVEVKGPGDDLQPHQIRWLQHLAACDIPHAVARIERKE
ncbi:VRR-NUC domain-containing protein [Aeromonas schubertii]|uniref:VRR-NUC domain-containing protein n=1 Tax=Aeromonas schubertii TaxID=652 RepID=UPI0010A83A6F|nr:VRR-NUC domain-containing protein [Aeromonas schubertii]QCG49857.1 VRR-NUC domain-containing protein [Aeromonas schubertii]